MPEILCPLQDAAESIPDQPAIIAPHRQYTFREYHEYVAGAAVKLRKVGITEGDILAVALPRGTPSPILFNALFRIGAVAFPVNTRFPGQYLLEVLQKVRCRNMVVPYGASVTTVHGRLFAFAPHDIVEDRLEALPGQARVSLERPATIILTSGSAGPPKAALLSYGNHYHSARLSNRNIPVEPGDRWLISLPLYHVAGIGVLFRCLAGGAAVVLPSAKEELKDAIPKYDVTHVSLVSTQLYRLLQDESAIQAARGLKAILLGGGPLSEPLLRKAYDAGLPIYTSYGLTEMATQVTTTRPGDTFEKLLTSGRPLAPEDVRIAPDGEIQVRGAALFLGYVDDSRIHRPLTEDGWFDTGDLGNWDADGYLRVTGRRDNMFIAGGENIQPEEIEQRLCRLDGILQAIVVPIEHPEFGAAPVAFIRLAERTSLNGATLAARLAEELPKYKVPRHFFLLPVDDMAPDAKLSRQNLIARARRLVEAQA